MANFRLSKFPNKYGKIACVAQARLTWAEYS